MYQLMHPALSAHQNKTARIQQVEYILKEHENYIQSTKLSLLSEKQISYLQEIKSDLIQKGSLPLSQQLLLGIKALAASYPPLLLASLFSIFLSIILLLKVEKYVLWTWSIPAILLTISLFPPSNNISPHPLFPTEIQLKQEFQVKPHEKLSLNQLSALWEKYLVQHYVSKDIRNRLSPTQQIQAAKILFFYQLSQDPRPNPSLSFIPPHFMYWSAIILSTIWSTLLSISALNTSQIKKDG